MKISGCTIARNVIKYNYPVLESIQSILPICDEFVVNVGDSQDETLALIKSIKSDKIRIIQNVWDFSQKAEVLSHQTNLALRACRGDWTFYLQSDEVIHEEDLPVLERMMRRYLEDKEVEALRFKWFHFYGSYFRYRIDRGWYQKQDRIIRNNGEIESYGDAYGFRRKDAQPLKRRNTGCFLYHYGWVQPEDVMKQRRINAEKIGFVTLQEGERRQEYSYSDLNRFPIYWGTHPQGIGRRIREHRLSQKDLKEINKKYWWHPFKWLKVRYKTFKRISHKIE